MSLYDLNKIYQFQGKNKLINLHVLVSINLLERVFYWVNEYNIIDASEFSFVISFYYHHHTNVNLLIPLYPLIHALLSSTSSTDPINESLPIEQKKVLHSSSNIIATFMKSSLKWSLPNHAQCSAGADQRIESMFCIFPPKCILAFSHINQYGIQTVTK